MVRAFKPYVERSLAESGTLAHGQEFETLAELGMQSQIVPLQAAILDDVLREGHNGLSARERKRRAAELCWTIASRGLRAVSTGTGRVADNELLRFVIAMYALGMFLHWLWHQL